MLKTRDPEGSSPPTCWSQYPPPPAMCLLLETRHSETGPFARVAARVEKSVQVAYHLESHTGPNGAVAVAQSPVYLDTSSAMRGPPLTRPETTKEGPISRVLCHPTAEIESWPQQVSTHIECTTTSQGSFAKVTQSTWDKEAVNQPAIPNTCFQVKHHAKPIAKKDLSSKNGSSSETQNESTTFGTETTDGKTLKEVTKPNGMHTQMNSIGKVSEARVDKRIANNRVIDTLEGSNVQRHTEAKGSLKIKEEIESDATYSSIPTGGKLHNSDGSSKFSAPAKRNGLDPNLPEMQGQGSKHFNRKIQKQRSFQKVDAVSMRKLDKTNQNSSGRQVEKEGCNFEGIPLPSPEELISDYKDYLSESQLKRYEYCSSRRNGLQDECYLSVPRAVLQIKREEMKNVKTNV